jgi:hypothetical protein
MRQPPRVGDAIACQRPAGAGDDNGKSEGHSPPADRPQEPVKLQEHRRIMPTTPKALLETLVESLRLTYQHGHGL